MVGKLIALGKQFKPIQSTKFEIILRAEIVIEPDRQPDEVIMADLLDRGFRSHYPSWDKDVLVGRTAEFERVRILDPTDQIGSAQRQPTVDRADLGGRPTERDTILTAFHQCVITGKIKSNLTHRRCRCLYSPRSIFAVKCRIIGKVMNRKSRAVVTALKPSPAILEIDLIH